MKFQYGPFDGNPFPSADSLFPEPRVMEFILQYGEQALDAMQNLEEPDEQQFVQEMIDAGLLEEYQDEQGSRRLRLTPKMVKGLQHRALLEIFAHLQKGPKDGHPTPHSGASPERAEGTKPYSFGDPISEVDLGATMRNAAARQVQDRSRSGGEPAGLTLPLRVSLDDFELHLTEGMADCATVVLIDLSGSMTRYGRYLQAKRVAMGLSALVAQQFPRDTVDFVGFSSLAEPVRERDLPLLMPKPVSIYDHQVRIRVDLEEARRSGDCLPQHFTNLQLGLRQARQILSRRGATNKQVFVITDGQPTAHVEPNPKGAGEMLYLLYPPTERTATATLKEALRCQQLGIRIASFAMIEDYWGMDWVGFIDRLTRLTRGTAFYCTSEDLSSTVIESYLTGKKRKQYIG